MKKRVVIELVNVWKTYWMGDVAVHALCGLNLTIYEGEFLSIMGPSGSGKSTCLNMIGCLDLPTRGHIYLDGHDIASFSESDLAQIRGEKIGFIFQQFNLINTLTAKENVMLPMIFQGVPAAERHWRAEELLSLVNLRERMDHRPTELSGGQQQRVAIARALAVKPSVILADEPTGNLDTKTGETVMDFLTRLHEEKGTTIVLVTHDKEVARHADRIELLRDGRLEKKGRKKEG